MPGVSQSMSVCRRDTFKSSCSLVNTLFNDLSLATWRGKCEGDTAYDDSSGAKPWIMHSISIPLLEHMHEAS